MQYIHTIEIKVSADHLDHNNHVNNVQFVNWVEQAAAEHWDILKVETPYESDYWVLYDHHIQYKKQVFLGDTILVKTYPEPPEGVKQPRKVEFYVNDKLMVDSRTLWVLCDSETNKVRRLGADWLARYGF
ncbi:acyl-CoA thioesterase [Sphingobacterium tabacisoli]|uniref:Acyl-CoA thioesterase n=1 Tax=Sphingobacterium tabacisoli TaxID=2044855 RepID=A0ABW5L743_9SPHI|nr:acyl-CoA thioesterase [Sphingobacterium tabacisoli]